SNFPLAFSVCGGDTASALASGNPVVVKGHPAHPGTSEMAARVVQEAARDCDMPEGVFSLVHGTEPSLSVGLVRHPATRAVGFTGSLQAGRALFDAAVTRPVPVPVFAEMGSINPVFIFPDAMKTRGTQIAQSLAKSVTVGVGQFCTKPGLLIGLRDASLTLFSKILSDAISATPCATMLHSGISDRYRAGITRRQNNRALQLTTTPKSDLLATQVSSAVFTTDAKSFLRSSELAEELFGPATLVIGCESHDDLEAVAGALEGQLTVTIHATERDVEQHSPIL